MSCCDKFKEIDIDGAKVCENCHCVQFDPIFEDTGFDSFFNLRSMRISKFHDYIDKCSLPGPVKLTLVEMFPRFESYFKTTSRTNFVHLGQLIRSFLKISGYPVYCDMFPQLKTKSRAKQVTEMADDCFKLSGDIPVVRLLDMEFLEPKCGEIDLSKANVDHTYIDADCYKKGLKTETKAKAKYKAPRQTKRKEGKGRKGRETKES